MGEANGCALWFDIERARREEKRSRLAKAFSKLFKRKPKSNPTSAGTTITTGTGLSENEWSDIPLHSLQPVAENEDGGKKKGFGHNCKRFFDGIFQASSAPKPIQKTIPEEFKHTRDDEVSMSPIRSQHDLTELRKKQQPAAILAPVPSQKEFQKLAVDQWRRTQERMADGTFAFPPGFSQKYRLLQVIGEGSFGFVMAAERIKDGKEVAVKWALREKIPPKMWTYDTELGLVPSEVHTLRQFSHPCIIQMLDYFDGGGDYVCMVTELHGTEWSWPNSKLSHERNPGLRPATQLAAMKHPQDPSSRFPRRSPCDLFECIEAHGHLPERIVYKIFAQMLDAVTHMKDSGWVHRDLKDENIVVDEQYRIKLVDFGSASLIPAGPNPEDRYFKQFNGTLAFAAPEIIKGHWYNAVAAEVWTLGILLFTMAYKKAPFLNTEEILNVTPKEIEQDEPRSSLNSLLQRMLEKDWTRRIGIDEIRIDPWIVRCSQLYPIT